MRVAYTGAGSGLSSGTSSSRGGKEKKREREVLPFSCPSSTNAVPGKQVKIGSVTGTTTNTTANAANTNTESELVVLHDDTDGDGWLEVGKRDWTVVTCMICLFFFWFWFCVAFFSISLLPSMLPSMLPSFLLPYPFTRLLIWHSPIHR